MLTTAHEQRLNTSDINTAETTQDIAPSAKNNGYVFTEEILSGHIGSQCRCDEDEYFDIDTQKQVYLISLTEESPYNPSIGYIGSTRTSLNQRLASHRADPKSAAYDFVNNRDCTIRRLDIADDDHATLRERYFIDFFQRNGTTILNKYMTKPSTQRTYHCEICNETNHHMPQHMKTKKHKRNLEKRIQRG